LQPFDRGAARPGHDLADVERQQAEEIDVALIGDELVGFRRKSSPDLVQQNVDALEAADGEIELRLCQRLTEVEPSLEFGVLPEGAQVLVGDCIDRQSRSPSVG